MNLLTSCVTTKVNKYAIPEVVKPLFPDPYEVTFDSDENEVKMPLHYWLLICDFKIDVDSVFEYLDELKKIYDGEEK